MSLLHLLFDLVSIWLVSRPHAVSLSRLAEFSRVLVVDFRDLLDSLALRISLLLHGGLKASFLLERSPFRFPSEIATWQLS